MDAAIQSKTKPAEKVFGTSHVLLNLPREKPQTIHLQRTLPNQINFMGKFIFVNDSFCPDFCTSRDESWMNPL